MLSLVLVKNSNLCVYLIYILSNKLDLNQETCFTINQLISSKHNPAIEYIESGTGEH
jgi:hypothetical protein